MIIGISGKKGAGKDTVCGAIWGDQEQAFHVGFVDAIQELVFSLYPEIEVDSWQGLSRQKVKSQVLECGLTVREVLQEVGNFFRSLDPDFWVKQWKRKVECVKAELGPGTLVLNSSVRYPNEVKAIQDMGGKVIRLTRTPYPEDQHESEVALDHCQEVSWAVQERYGRCWAKKELTMDTFDYVLDNRNMTVEEQNEKVIEIVKGWI